MKTSIAAVLWFATMTASALVVSQFTPRAVVSPRTWRVDLQEAGFTSEQTAALEEASISLRRVGEQKTDFGRDRTFFFALRNKNEDPDEESLGFLLICPEFLAALWEKGYTREYTVLEAVAHSGCTCQSHPGPLTSCPREGWTHLDAW